MAHHIYLFPSLCLVLLFLCSVSSVLVYQNDTFPILQWNGDFPNNNSQRLVHFSSPNLTNSLVFYSDKTSIKNDPKVQFLKDMNWLKSQNILGVVVIGVPPVIGQASVYNFPSGSVPIGIVSAEAGTVISGSLGDGVMVLFLGWDPNPWREAMESPFYPLYWGSLMLIGTCLAVYSGLKLYTWLNDEFKLQIGTICLGLEFGSVLIQVIHFALHPYNNLYGLPYAYVLDTLYFPFSLSSSTIIIIFWLQISRKTLQRYQKIVNMIWYPIIVACCVFGLLELIVIIMYVAEIRTANDIVIVYLIVFFFLGMIYFFTAWMVMRNSKNTRRDTNKIMKKITYRMIMSGLAVWLGCLFAILVLLPFNSSPGIALTLYYMLWIMLYLNSFIQISIFDWKIDLVRPQTEGATA